jgi:hypothetical protein
MMTAMVWRDQIHVLVERQAEVHGRLDLVAAMAHAHPPPVAGPHV